MKRSGLLKFSSIFIVLFFSLSFVASALSSSMFCSSCELYTAHTKTIVKEATCSSKGEILYVCIYCEFETVEYIPKLSHTFTTSTVPASCETKGKKTTICSVCSYVSSTETIPALGHSYSSRIVSSATCVSSGTRRYSCTRSGCSDYYDSSISPLGHDLVVSVTGVTCVLDGVKVTACSRCNYSSSESVAALGHLLSSATVDPSCTVEGSKVTSCSRCDYTETEVLAALGHALTTEVVDASCISDGSKVSTCSRCDFTSSETIPMFGHDWQETSRIEPTYTSEGKVVTTCSRCLETTTEIIPALDADTCTHTWVEIDRVDPTYSSSGKVDYECSSCGSTMSETLPVLDPSYCVHQFEEDSRVEPTYDADGMITYKCLLCGTSKVVRVPMLTPDTEDPSVLTGLSISFASIFGLYEPIMTTHVTTTSSASEVTQVLTTGVADGAAGVDYEFLAGVFLFLILLYCVLRLFGGVLKQWRT